MSRDLNMLHPEVHARALALKLLASSQGGMDIAVTQTLRTYAEQDALYAQGRSTPSKVVTNAKGGDSLHNFGRAFDVAFRVAGAITWEGPWEHLGQLGEALGLEWGGRWKSFPDRPHFQWLADGATLASLHAEHEAKRIA